MSRAIPVAWIVNTGLLRVERVKNVEADDEGTLWIRGRMFNDVPRGLWSVTKHGAENILATILASRATHLRCLADVLDAQAQNLMRRVSAARRREKP